MTGRAFNAPATTRANTPQKPSPDALAAARNDIERIDRTIVVLIAERLNAAASIVAAKREGGLPVLDPEQEARVVRRAGEWAREAGLPEEELRDLFWRIIAVTRRSQGAVDSDGSSGEKV